MTEVQKIDKSLLSRKTMGSLWGVFIGDAMGLPVECKSPREIRDLYGYVDDFKSNKHHKYPNVAHRKAGTISDDSQLTLTMMEALKTGYDIKTIKQEHVNALKGRWGRPVGWGKSTKEACKKMEAGETPAFAPDGAGNGVCMKIAPLAIYSVYKTRNSSHNRFTDHFNKSLLKRCREVSLLTHGDPACIVATYCQARMIIRAMQNELPKSSINIANLFIRDARYAEGILKAEWRNGLLSDRIEEICSKENFELSTPVVSVNICTERSSYVYNSYPFVVYCVSKYLPYENFQYALTETINAGADADSNASMVCSIIGAHLEYYSIPLHFVEGVENHQKLTKLVKDFESVI